MQPKVVIIVLNWNRKDDTIACIDSLSKTSYNNYQILLIDNHSTDDSVISMKQLYPELKIIVNEDNYGYAKGNNIGIEHALNEDTEYILLLNNDTIVDPEFLSKMIKTAEESENAGIVGPKIYFYNYKGKYNIINSIGAFINYYNGSVKLKGFKEIDEGQYKKTEDVDYVEGACILIKREVFNQIGNLNQKYFMYWEETDFCVRAKKAGFRVVTSPDAIIWHKSVPKTSLINNQFRLYYITRNMILFEKKNATIYAYIIFLIQLFGYRFWKTSFIIIFYFKNIQSLRTYYASIKDGILGNEGPITAI